MQFCVNQLQQEKLKKYWKCQDRVCHGVEFIDFAKHVVPREPVLSMKLAIYNLQDPGSESVLKG